MSYETFFSLDLDLDDRLVPHVCITSGTDMGVLGYTTIMYGLPSPHNSESSSAYIKEEDKNRCGCKLFMRVYFGITRKQVIQE